jgi:hypothetical protein
VGKIAKVAVPFGAPLKFLGRFQSFCNPAGFNRYFRELTTNTMAKFIELQVTDETETKPHLINIDSVGRIYPNPQNTRKSIVELNYHSISDAPVYLEVEEPYEKLKAILLED